MNKNSKIYIAGHTGLVGSALIRQLYDAGYSQLLVHTFDELDLRNQQAVNNFFAQEQPEYVFLVAAKVGGIKANADFPATFIYDNVMIASNVIHAAYQNKVKKLLFFGSSCIYPRLCQQPIKEDYLMTGSLEETNKAYAIAKIAGIQLCQSYNRQYGTRFIACMPTNLYGLGDNFDMHNAHVIPALIAKIYQATINSEPSVVLWGTGKPLREFLFVDDVAEAALFLMQQYESAEIINIGSGQEVSIRELAVLIQTIIGHKGSLFFDSMQPDGTPRKLLDCTKLHTLGWHAKTSLKEGLTKTIEWYITHIQKNKIHKINSMSFVSNV